jgi:hypothetical protein
MDETTREKIIIVLTSYLNREPSEQEIQNAVTDPRIMQWVAELP